MAGDPSGFSALPQDRAHFCFFRTVRKGKIVKETDKDSYNKACGKTAPYNKKSIKIKSLRIAVTYLLIGCFWILVTDVLADFVFADSSELVAVSIVKGLFYVLATSVIIYALIYPPLKNLIISERTIKNAYAELEVSNAKYLGLYREFDEKQALLKALIDSTEDWIFYKDTTGNYLGCNTAFEKFTGVKEEELIGLKLQSLFNSDVASSISKSDFETLSERKPCKYEQTFCRANGDTVIIEMLNTPYYDQNGNIIGIISVGRDITERKQREDRIRYLSYHDTLTGLYNRAYYEEARKLLDNRNNLPISVIVCDVDGLKLVNDAFGHAAGDAMLIGAAQVLKKCCREQDVIFRTGGDEFCIMLPNTETEEAEKVFEDIGNVCEEKKTQSERALLSTSISLGYDTKTQAEQALNEVIESAEAHMYQRKLLARKGVHSILLKSITTTLHEKSNETQEHCKRMAGWARVLGQSLKLPYRDLDTLELAAALHDIGKINVDLSILQKPGELNAEEWEAIRKHPEIGYRIAQSIPELYPISEVVLCHHERWDGKGYPRGLMGIEIPLPARILSIVDSYDAMISDRPYRKALSEEAAKAEILKMAGTQFDPDIAVIFAENVLTQGADL